MAVLTQNSLQLLVDEMVDELSLGLYPMVNRLQKKTISQKVLKWNANVGGATATGEATTASVSTFSEDTVVPASLAIGSARLRHSFTVQKEDIAEAATAGKGALRDLFAYELDSGMRVIMETLSTRVYDGAGTNAHGGLFGLDVVAANGAYAGIDPATYTKWLAVLQTNGTNRALTASLMYGIETSLFTNGGTYTAVYTTPGIIQKYKELFLSNASIINQLPAGQADLGYTGLTFAGRPLIQDPYAPANKLYFVNEPEVYLYTFAQNNTQNRNGLQFAVEKLPSSNPDAELYVVYLKPQLQVRNRNKALGVLGAITQ